MRLPTVHVTAGSVPAVSLSGTGPVLHAPAVTSSPPCQDLTSCYFFVLLLVFDLMLFVLDDCERGKSGRVSGARSVKTARVVFIS